MSEMNLFVCSRPLLQNGRVFKQISVPKTSFCPIKVELKMKDVTVMEWYKTVMNDASCLFSLNTLMNGNFYVGRTRFLMYCKYNFFSLKQYLQCTNDCNMPLFIIWNINNNKIKH